MRPFYNAALGYTLRLTQGILLTAVNTLRNQRDERFVHPFGISVHPDPPIHIILREHYRHPVMNKPDLLSSLSSQNRKHRNFHTLDLLNPVKPGEEDDTIPFRLNPELLPGLFLPTVGRQMFPLEVITRRNDAPAVLPRLISDPVA